MSLLFQKIDNEELYRNFVEQFYFLAEHELKKIEEFRMNGDHHQVALFLPKIISVINVIGYFRGQDNMFVDFRPHVSFQEELYQREKEFEDRLRILIDYVLTSESKKTFLWSMAEYYFKQRGLKKDN